MEYQEVCLTSPILYAVDLLTIALVLATFVVRFRHQGFIVHAGYWLMAWIQQSDRVFENVVLAGLIHIVALSASFVHARAARRLRPSTVRTSTAGVAETGDRAQTPFALFSA
ncbi:MAG TPA: hypothetical protein VF142_20355 [Longimicrobium sp.]